MSRSAVLSLSLLFAAAPLTVRSAETPAAAPSAAGSAADSNPAAQIPWERLDTISEEFDKVREELEPRIEELSELRNLYESPKDYREIVRKRESLRRGIQEYLTPALELDKRYRETQKQITMQAVTLGFAVAMAGGSLKDSDQEISKAIRYQQTYKNMHDFTRNVRKELNDDNGAFQKMELARAEKNRLYLLGAGGFAVLLITLVVTLRVTRRQPETISAIPTTYPPADQGALSGPSAQQNLSGPVGSPLSGPSAPHMLSGPVGGPVSGPAGPKGLPAPEGAAEAVVLGGNFRVDKELGRGGMGLVYEATDLTLQRKVAVKRMRPEVVENQKELDMFLAEARVVAALKHPNLVEIHSIFREEGQVYLVFEHVAGRTLSAVIEEEGKLPVGKAAEVAKQVASALDYAHSKKVIHRDLKPSNIMLTEDGPVKVMDFGIAHQAKKTVAKMTKAAASGTPPYMAPEQELGTVSRESDIYSLAVCYYEMVTGEMPFQGPNFLAQKREMVYTPPSEAVPGLPKALDELVAQALQADPRRRFHTGAEFSSALLALPGA